MKTRNIRLLLITTILLTILACTSSNALDVENVTNEPNEVETIETTAPVEENEIDILIDKYMDDYGGKFDVYERIFSSTSCNDLQDEFDIASDNNNREDPGTDMFRITLGYMKAIDERMQDIGCY